MGVKKQSGEFIEKGGFGRRHGTYRKLHHIDGEKIVSSPAYSFSRVSTERMGPKTKRSTQRPLVSKEHERENYGAHSPGPWQYSPKSTLTRAGQTGVGSSHKPYQRTPTVRFGTASRF